MYKQDLALNNLQYAIKPNQIKSNQTKQLMRCVLGGNKMVESIPI